MQVDSRLGCALEANSAHVNGRRFFWIAIQISIGGVSGIIAGINSRRAGLQGADRRRRRSQKVVLVFVAGAGAG